MAESLQIASVVVDCVADWLGSCLTRITANVYNIKSILYLVLIKFHQSVIDKKPDLSPLLSSGSLTTEQPAVKRETSSPSLLPSFARIENLGTGEQFAVFATIELCCSTPTYSSSIKSCQSLSSV